MTETVVAVCLAVADASGELPRAARRRLELARARLGQPAPSGRGRWAVWVREALRPPDHEVRMAFRLVHDRWRPRPQFERDRGLHDLLRAAVEGSRRLVAGRTPASARSGALRFRAGWRSQRGGGAGEKQVAVRSTGRLPRLVDWPTLEVVVTETPAHLRKQIDEETGLALVRLPS